MSIYIGLPILDDINCLYFINKWSVLQFACVFFKSRNDYPNKTLSMFTFDLPMHFFLVNTIRAAFFLAYL